MHAPFNTNRFLLLFEVLTTIKKHLYIEVNTKFLPHRREIGKIEPLVLFNLQLNWIPT